LAEEIELRRHIERVAAQRRALPPGGEVTGDYRFQGEDGSTDFAGLLGDKQALAVYSYMFGPQRERPCNMCTNLLGAWEGNAADIGQRISLVVTARSPIERLIAWKRERGWKNLRLYSDLNGAYSRDYFGVLPGHQPLWYGSRPPREDTGMSSAATAQPPRRAAPSEPILPVIRGGGPAAPVTIASRPRCPPPASLGAGS
jgi:hypothetical protein